LLVLGDPGGGGQDPDLVAREDGLDVGLREEIDLGAAEGGIGEEDERRLGGVRGLGEHRVGGGQRQDADRAGVEARDARGQPGQRLGGGSRERRVKASRDDGGSGFGRGGVGRRRGGGRGDRGERRDRRAELRRSALDQRA